MTDYRIQEDEEMINVTFLYPDGRRVASSVSSIERISELKQRVFSSEQAENKTVKLFHMGKLLEDAKTPRDFSTFYSEIEKNSFIHVAVVSECNPPPPVIQPMIQVHEEDEEQRQIINEGTNSDLFLGIILGFFFHVLVFLCVMSTQILMGRFNKRQKYGCFIGILLYVWVAMSYGNKDNDS